MENESSIEIGPVEYWIHPDDFPVPKEYIIESFEIEETKWGKKGTLRLYDVMDNDIKRISTWNLCSTRVFKMDVSLIGKKINLEPYNDKRVKATLL